jgi:hypothetical protein
MMALLTPVNQGSLYTSEDFVQHGYWNSSQGYGEAPMK